MKRAFTLIEAVIVVAILLFVAVVLFPAFNRQRGSRRVSCQSNLKQIGLGFMQYVQDYDDERFPPARITSSSGWADVLQPYVKSTQIFQCYTAPDAATNTFTTDYFYNRRLARVTTDKLSLSATTLLAGDGDDNAPAWNSWSQLPPDALTNEKSPSQRHLGTGNYLFADGHVKALRPDKISTTSPDGRTFNPTFAVR